MLLKDKSLPLFILAAFASMGGLLMGFDIGLISSILLFIKTYFTISAWKLGFIASMIVPGTMLGALFMSISGKRLARTSFILVSGGIAFLALSACAVSQSANQILMGRLALGIAIGISLVNVPLYLAHAAPLNKRGFAVTFFQLAITFGIMLGSGVGYWLSHYSNWRLMFWSSAFVSLLQIFCGCLLMVLHKPQMKSSVRNDNKHLDIPTLFNKSTGKLLLIGNTLAILHQLTGINAIVYFAPQIFQYTHHASAITATFITWLMLSANFLFTILSLFIFDVFGSRKILLASFILQTISLLALGLSLSFMHPSPYGMLALILIYFLGFAAGLGPGLFVVAAELYPASIRNQAMGFVIFTNNIAAFIVICSFPILLQFVGINWLFLAFGGISFLGWLFVYRMVNFAVIASVSEAN